MAALIPIGSMYAIVTNILVDLYGLHGCKYTNHTWILWGQMSRILEHLDVVKSWVPQGDLIAFPLKNNHLFGMGTCFDRWMGWILPLDIVWVEHTGVPTHVKHTQTISPIQLFRKFRISGWKAVYIHLRSAHTQI